MPVVQSRRSSNMQILLLTPNFSWVSRTPERKETVSTVFSRRGKLPHLFDHHASGPESPEQQHADPLINTQLQLGVPHARTQGNRFNGFLQAWQATPSVRSSCQWSRVAGAATRRSSY